MASSEEQIDSAFDVLRRLPPQNIEKNLRSVLTLQPGMTEELLAGVDQPLKQMTDRTNNRQYLCCEYNRDGDSYRSPWSNTYEPPLAAGHEGVLPSERMRRMENSTNEAMETYLQLYFDGGLSSSYFWEVPGGFAACILFKKVDEGKRLNGTWDSIHVLEVIEKGGGGRTARYKLTSTVIFWLSLGQPAPGSQGASGRRSPSPGPASSGVSDPSVAGHLQLGGSMTRQSEGEAPIGVDRDHIIKIGSMIEELENKIRDMVSQIYFQKTKDVMNGLRQQISQAERQRQDMATAEIASQLKARANLDNN